MSPVPSLEPRLRRLGLDVGRLGEHLASRLAPLPLARVSVEHRGGYLLEGSAGQLRAGLTGRLRASVRGEPMERPVVGDWVAYSTTGGDAMAIHGVLPRRSSLVRRAADGGRAQLLVTNVELALIVAALLDGERPRGLERYLSMCLEGGVAPRIVLTKADRSSEAPAVVEALRQLAPGVPVHVVSALTGEGVEALRALLPDKTSVLLGNSGVGKSTLINAWLGHSALETRATRASDDKGRHTTTARHLFALPTGGVIIDTPGMRELGVWRAEEGLAETFAELEALALGCQFRDCSHTAEPGCRLLLAIAQGALDAGRLAAWKALSAEARQHAAPRARRGPRARRQR